MTFRIRGIELPDWGSQLGSAVNRVYVEYLRREQRKERAQVEHDMMVAYALAGSPEADHQKRFEVVDATRKVLYSHIDQTVHRTEYKKLRLEQQAERLRASIEEMERIDWISSDAFSIAEWLAGK